MTQIAPMIGPILSHHRRRFRALGCRSIGVCVLCWMELGRLRDFCAFLLLLTVMRE